MWSPAQSGDRQFWLQFLEKYKSFRFLWDVDERAHSNRAERHAAYEELAEMTKSVTPDANVLFVKNRIASFRTCFRREIKKVKAAKANGTTYKPSLFYFNAMRFLVPDEDDYEPESTTWDNACSDNEDPFCNVSTTILPEPERETAIKVKSEAKKTYQKVLEKSDEGEDSDNSIAAPLPPKRTKTDEYELLGQRIAAHFRKMDDEQSLIAEKIISDVCFYGRMKVLTLQTGLNIEISTSGRQQRHNRRNDCQQTEEVESFYEYT